MQQLYNTDGKKLLKQWLEGKKITTYKFARLMDISDNCIWCITNGHRRPNLITAIRMEQLTNGSVPCKSWALEEELTMTVQPKKSTKDKACQKNDTKGKNSTKKLTSK